MLTGRLVQLSPAAHRFRGRRYVGGLSHSVDEQNVRALGPSERPKKSTIRQNPLTIGCERPCHANSLMQRRRSDFEFY